MANVLPRRFTTRRRAMPDSSPSMSRRDKINPFPQRFKDATFTAWLPDGSGILFVADQVEALKEIPRKVWLQPYPRGEPRRVTARSPRVPEIFPYAGTAARSCPSGSTRSIRCGDCRSMARLPQRIASERYDGLLGIAPLTDGRFVMSTGERGNSQLAIVDRTGGSRETLTREGTNIWPAVHPTTARLCSSRTVTSRRGSGG